MRYLLATLAVLALVGGLAAIKGGQIATLMAQGREAQEMGPAPEAVDVWRARAQSWERTIDAVGTVDSSRGLSVSNEVAGAVSRIAFESGELARRGEVLVELDASVERAELAAALAQEKLAKVEAARIGMLAATGTLPPADRDQAFAALATASARVTSLRAQLAKKIIRAPFAGRLGIRAVDLGQYLSPGTPITSLEATEEVFVDFTFPQERLADVAVGMPVRISYQGSDEAIAGSVAAIEPSVERSTRAVEVRALVKNHAERLRPGMFVDVAVVLPQQDERVVVPATAIVHAPYGDSVFVVVDKPPDAPGMRTTPDGKPVKMARQQFVRAGARRGDFVALLRAVEAGQHVVIAGGFKLQNGAPVVVTESAQPRPELQPRPKNR